MAPYKVTFAVLVLASLASSSVSQGDTNAVANPQNPTPNKGVPSNISSSTVKQNGSQNTGQNERQNQTGGTQTATNEEAGQSGTNSQQPQENYVDTTDFVNGVNGWNFRGWWMKLDLSELKQEQLPVPRVPDSQDQGVFLCQAFRQSLLGPNRLEKEYPPLRNARLQLSYYVSSDNSDLIMTGKVVNVNKELHTVFNYTYPDDLAEQDGVWVLQNFTLHDSTKDGDFKVQLEMTTGQSGVWAVDMLRVVGVVVPPPTPAPSTTPPPKITTIQVTPSPANISQNITTPANISQNATSPTNTSQVTPSPANITQNVTTPANISQNVTTPANISQVTTSAPNISQVTTSVPNISQNATSPANISQVTTAAPNISQNHTSPANLSQVTTKAPTVSQTNESVLTATSAHIATTAPTNFTNNGSNNGSIAGGSFAPSEKPAATDAEVGKLASIAQAIWDAFYVFLALFCACLVALVALIVHGRCKHDEPPPAVATYNPRTASYRLDKVYDNPAYDSNAV